MNICKKIYLNKEKKSDPKSQFLTRQPQMWVIALYVSDTLVKIALAKHIFWDTMGLSTLKGGNSRVYPYPYPSKGKGKILHISLLKSSLQFVKK